LLSGYFDQLFSYIMVVRFLVEETGVPRETLIFHITAKCYYKRVV